LSPPFANKLHRPLTIIFLIVFLDLLGAGILVPVFPFLVRHFQSDALTVGLAGFAFSAAQFAATPVLGVLSDRYGRRPILLISLLGTAIGYFLTGWAATLWLLFFSRFLDGLTGGNISAAQAYIADVSEPQDRAKNFGLIGAAFGLGFIVGPAIGGLLAKISLAAPAFAAGIFSLATLAAAYFFLPESLAKEKRTSGVIRWSELDPMRQIARQVVRPPLTLLFGCLFALNFAIAGLQTNFGVYSFDRFALGPTENASIFAAIGLTGAFTQGWLIRRLTKIPGTRLAYFGFALAVAGFLQVAFAPSAWYFFPACMTIAAGVGLVNPALTGILSSRVELSEQGVVLGVLQSLASLTRAVAPVWAGAIYDSVGESSPYWTGAIWLTAGWAMAIRASSAASKPPSRAAPSSR
jgi:MFS family permease